MTQQRANTKPPEVRPWMGETNPPTNKAKRAKRCRCERPVTISDEVGTRCVACSKAVA